MDNVSNVEQSCLFEKRKVSSFACIVDVLSKIRCIFNDEINLFPITGKLLFHWFTAQFVWWPMLIVMARIRILYPIVHRNGRASGQSDRRISFFPYKMDWFCMIFIPLAFHWFGSSIKHSWWAETHKPWKKIDPKPIRDKWINFCLVRRISDNVFGAMEFKNAPHHHQPTSVDIICWTPNTLSDCRLST